MSTTNGLIGNILIIWKEVVGSLRMMSGQNEKVCGALDQHPRKAQFAKTLIEVAQYCTRNDDDTMPLLMDVLILIGDLTASDNFSERTFYTENDFFTTLKTILGSPALGMVEFGLLSSGDDQTQTS